VENIPFARRTCATRAVAAAKPRKPFDVPVLLAALQSCLRQGAP